MESQVDKRKQGRNNKKRGQAEERWFAKKLGGWRNKNDGESHPDVETEFIAVEVKSHSYPTPLYITEPWDQLLSCLVEDEEGFKKVPYVGLSFREKNGKRRRFMLQEVV